MSIRWKKRFGKIYEEEEDEYIFTNHTYFVRDWDAEPQDIEFRYDPDFGDIVEAEIYDCDCYIINMLDGRDCLQHLREKIKERCYCV